MEKQKNKKDRVKNPRIYISIFLFFLIISLVISILYLTYSIRSSKPSLEREDVLGNLESGILRLKEQGKYKCCIEPDCKMCYLGNWIFENGECYCDDKIVEGKMDEVCPECISGIEKGLCSSTRESCKI